MANEVEKPPPLIAETDALMIESKALTKQGQDLKVTNPASKEAAGALQIKLRLMLRKMKARVEELQAPYKKDIKDIQTAAKPFLDAVMDVDAKLGNEIHEYTAKVNRRIEAAQAKLNQRFEATVDKAAAKSIETGKPMAFLAPPQQLQHETTRVETEDGTRITTMVKAWRINKTPQELGCQVKMNKKGEMEVQYNELTYARAHELQLNIPWEYFVLDAGRIGRVIKSGGAINGITVYDKPSDRVVANKEGDDQ